MPVQGFPDGWTQLGSTSDSKRYAWLGDADKAWREAIREAHANGASLRAIGDAAGITHVRVIQILRAMEDPSSA